MDTLAATIKIRNKAYELGFDLCGFARAEKLDREAARLETWLNQNRHGTMEWMENNFEKRVDPTRLVPGAKSVVSVLASYRFRENEEYDHENSGPKIAKYARGRDYHKVFKKKLKQLFFYAKEELGDLHGRLFVDSAPVMDKVWAQRAGLGWIGKNSNLLNKQLGSWFLIGEMILDIPFVYDAPETEHCGTCTRCIDACPTDAIYEPFKVDGSRCISYLTIELKDNIPPEFRKQLGEWMFGCDICQDVCPWNRKAEYGRINDLKPRAHVMHPPHEKKWSEITPDQFDAIFEGSPVRRAKYEWFTENAALVEKYLD